MIVKGTEKCMNTEKEYKYFAFISYSSKDIAWGKRLQRKLEGYRMPATLCSEHGWERKPINPVFFAPTDIQPGGLTDELQERLRASRNLIVICSPHSAQSEWVGKEIAYFHALGRSANIHFFIVDGVPHSGSVDTECFNPVVKQLGIPEILGANIHEKVYSLAWLNRERAYVQLITKLLGVEFDSIWQRHKRILRRKIALGIMGGLVVLALVVGVWYASRPIAVNMQLKELTPLNEHLPHMQDAIVTLQLDNETKHDTIHSLVDTAWFANIPPAFVDKEVRVKIQCRDFVPLDTMILLQQQMILGLQRDTNIYGNICVRVWSLSKGKVLPHYPLILAGKEVVSDENGYITLQIPLAEQRMEYEVSGKHLLNNKLSMPCGESDVILVK